MGPACILRALRAGGTLSRTVLVCSCGDRASSAHPLVGVLPSHGQSWAVGGGPWPSTVDERSSSERRARSLA